MQPRFDSWQVPYFSSLLYIFLGEGGKDRKLRETSACVLFVFDRKCFDRVARLLALDSREFPSPLLARE